MEANNLILRCEATASPVSLHKEGYLLLLVNVKPNSKESAVAAIDDKQAHIQISAPPKDGEANEELIAYLSKVTGAKVTVEAAIKIVPLI